MYILTQILLSVIAFCTNYSNLLFICYENRHFSAYTLTEWPICNPFEILGSRITDSSKRDTCTGISTEPEVAIAV